MFKGKNEVRCMYDEYDTYHSPEMNFKIKKWPFDKFGIDTTHYKYNGPRIVKTFKIEF